MSEASTCSPSLLRYSPAVILFIAAVADASRFADPDLWGHILYGNQVIARHGLVFTNPYSYSAPGCPWRTHEWMSELALAWVYGHFGVIGLKLMKFVCALAITVCLALSVAETGATPALQLATLLISALTIGPSMQFRPQLFDFIFLSAVLALLARDIYRKRAPLWVVVPIMALWSNLHGGFFVGLAVLAIYSAMRGVVDLARSEGLGHSLKLSGLLLVSAAATLANPLGIETWSAVVDQVTNPITRHIIGDWLPLLFVMRESWRSGQAGNLEFAIVLAAMGVTIVSFFASPRLKDLPLFAIAMAMIAAAFASIRNVALAGIAIAGPLARHGSLLLASRASARVVPTPQRARPLQQGVVVLVTLALMIETGLFSRNLSDRGYPAGAVAFIRTHDLHGRILNKAEWGGFLEWHLYPQCLVYIDSRYDLVYPEEVILDYAYFYKNTNRAADVLRKYPPDYVLIAPDEHDYEYMSHQPGWVMMYSDNEAALFERAGSTAALPAPKPAFAQAPDHYFP